MTKEEFEILKNDPLFWSNNKRKMHGLPPLRKDCEPLVKKKINELYLAAFEITTNSLWSYTDDVVNILIDKEKIC